MNAQLPKNPVGFQTPFGDKDPEMLNGRWVERRYRIVTTHNEESGVDVEKRIAEDRPTKIRTVSPMRRVRGFMPPKNDARKLRTTRIRTRVRTMAKILKNEEGESVVPRDTVRRMAKSMNEKSYQAFLRGELV